MSHAVDHTGKMFGKLTVIERGKNSPATPSNPHGSVRWWCKCECGSKRVLVRSEHLMKGKTQSCGCLARQLASERYKFGWDHKQAAKKIPVKVRRKRAKAGARARANATGCKTN